MTKFSFCTVIAPGCHGGANAPIVSKHRTLDAAIAAAKRNDRLAVHALDYFRDQPYQTGPILFILPPQGDRRMGAGRYGNGAGR